MPEVREDVAKPVEQSATDPLAADGPILLFDGVCNLCNAGVLFIIRRDPRGRIRFCPLQSDTARALLEQAAGADWAAPPTTDPDTMILIEGPPGARRIRVRSSAALRVATHLRWPWPLLGAFWIVPQPVRDLVYRLIAHNRYRWFGRRDACMMPTPELRARFL